MINYAANTITIGDRTHDTLIDEVKAAFPRASGYEQLRPWCGLRPATPKGTPILGKTPFPNLYLNAGHGEIGRAHV